MRHWWAVGVPLLVLLPLPILLAVAPPEADSEVGTVGLGFLVAFSTAIQCALVAVGVGLARRSVRFVGSRGLLAEDSGGMVDFDNSYYVIAPLMILGP